MRRRAVLAFAGLLAAVGGAQQAVAAVRDPSTHGHAFAASPVLERGAARNPAQYCRRWRSFAARLGETFAGHQLRSAVFSRLCGVTADEADEEVWSWPWRHYETRADLPPLRHGQYGAWEIRCSHVGRRKRCALALETVMFSGQAAYATSVRLVSHVVIDTVAGRESVLWRVHVASERGLFETERVGALAVRIGSGETAEKFDACGRLGCMAEADPSRSAEVASWLWSGRPVDLVLRADKKRREFVGVLQAHGFRAGLSELIRLRREEVRTLAGR